MFTEISPDHMQIAGTDGDHVRMYVRDNILIRKFFWLRLIFHAIRKFNNPAHDCLDVGGGSGAFLPTLASFFASVECIDLYIEVAGYIVEKFRLDNVTLHSHSILETGLADRKFEAIVAADVLEHFTDLTPPMDAIWNLMDDDGILYTSVPTESKLYGLLRRIFRMSKPEDHYHSGAEVEENLKRRGFILLQRRYVPLILPILPLYIISVWNKK